MGINYEELIHQKELEIAQYQVIIQQQKEEINRLISIINNSPSMVVINRCSQLLDLVDKEVYSMALRREDFNKKYEESCKKREHERAKIAEKYRVNNSIPEDTIILACDIDGYDLTSQGQVAKRIAKCLEQHKIIFGTRGGIKIRIRKKHYRK